MLQRLAYVSVLVGDQDRALDFYTDILGLELRADNASPDGARFLAVGVPGDDLDLILWPGTPGVAQAVGDHIPAAYTIATSNCREAVDELTARGVMFPAGVTERPWGAVALFEDPDGNRLQLREAR